MNIYLLWCTVRPEMFINTHSQWMDKCYNKELVKTKVAVNEVEHRDKLMSYDHTLDIMVTGNDRIGSAFPTYCLTSQLKGQDNDIVILSSDDMYPADGWDEYLIGRFKDFNGCLAVRDGYHDNSSTEEGIHPVTIPIMSYECLRKLNMIICHPAYFHLFADAELCLNIIQLGLIKDVRKTDALFFEHKHYVNGKRLADGVDAVNQMCWEHDSKLFGVRKKMAIEDRLKV